MQKNNFVNHQIPLSSSESSQTLKKKKREKDGFLNRAVEPNNADSE